MKKRVWCSLLAAMLLFLTGCGGGNGGGNATSASGGSASSFVPESPAMDMAEADFGYSENESIAAGGEVREAKMIRTAELSLESTAFEEAEKGLNQLIADTGGYLENSTLHSGGSSRWAEYTVRVPADKFQIFLDQAGTLCHLTWRSQSAENITEFYYDTQGRLKTQQIKLERLQELLSRAEAMEDIITIESAISETEQLIDSLSGTLQHYDALVDYATIHVSLQEVYRLSNVEEVPDSFGSRLANAFTSGLGSFGTTLENLVVALAYRWMWILILAAIGFAVFHRARKRRDFPPIGKNRDDNQPKG